MTDRSDRAGEDGVREALEEANACFDAGMSEGWIDALENGDLERLRDIWYRRMDYGLVALRSALSSNPPPKAPNQ